MTQTGPTAGERFIQGILPENPVYRQLLGLCPTLAVSNNLKAAATMGGAVLFVLLGANTVVSLMRNALKPHLRIVVFTLTIAAFVTIADRFLAAYLYAMSKQLGPYVPLIIVNCIIISRCEVCASKQAVPTVMADAVGQGIGFTLALLSIAFVRELLGAGTLWGIKVLPAAWPAWIIMLLPPGAFFTLGLLLALANWITEKMEERNPKAEGEAS